MAPASLALLPRQFGNGNGDGNGRFGNRDDGGVSRWAIIGIVVAVLVVAGIVGLVLFRRMRQRRSAVSSPSAINLASTSTAAHKPTSTGPSGSGNGNGNGPPKYGASTTGYGVTADQSQSLLGNAEPPAIVMWGPPQSDNAGSTQDGFGYDNNLQLAGTGIQRPASVASFSAPPPRYEEATTASAGAAAASRPQGQGEAASYFNAAVPMGDDTGRSPSRGRALSLDTRSLNGEGRRSISRFREEGMVDVNVSVNAEKS
ncbi:hypothetical protein G647_00329 [Cladophialophora carrionii CBS 160.54]|uniref:Uncharacterized protein n=1 Tax=Cladophialophora carrionii CBS 160.54 TaxID=1279043 RepID=V9DM01_9EURO|nr:uncharacterized protein G647_00329 [Cladophialophora carrionii CBS 160.54]ETI27880.1 hypothetical protein G647_00329 [Cladophialophora carrionii CBS 160.54]